MKNKEKKKIGFWEWIYISILAIPKRCLQIVKNAKKEWKEDPFYQLIIAGWGAFILTMVAVPSTHTLFVRITLFVWVVFLVFVFLHSLYRYKVKDC